MAAAVVAAEAPIGQSDRRHHEQPRTRIEVSRDTGRNRGIMCLQRSDVVGSARVETPGLGHQVVGSKTSGRHGPEGNVGVSLTRA